MDAFAIIALWKADGTVVGQTAGDGKKQSNDNTAHNDPDFA